MAAKKRPFLTDVKTLRARARRHIEQGAVTESYRADRKTVVNLLNEALATEIICVRVSRARYSPSTSSGRPFRPFGIFTPSALCF